MTARHADHIDQAVAQGMARRRDIVDPTGMEDRQLEGPPEAPRDLQMRPDRCHHAGHHVGQGAVALDAAGVDVQKVEHAGFDMKSNGLEAVLGTEVAFDPLVAADPEAEDEVVAHRAPHGLEQLEREARAVAQRAAVAVAAAVDLRAPELTGQVAVNQNLAAVEAALLAAPCGSGVGGDDPVDIVLVHLARKAAVRWLALARGRDHR